MVTETGEGGGISQPGATTHVENTQDAEEILAEDGLPGPKGSGDADRVDFYDANYPEKPDGKTPL